MDDEARLRLSSLPYDSLSENLFDREHGHPPETKWLDLRKYLPPSLKMLEIKNPSPSSLSEEDATEFIKALIDLVDGNDGAERKHSQLKQICNDPIMSTVGDSRKLSGLDKFSKLCERQQIELYAKTSGSKKGKFCELCGEVLTSM